MPQVKKAPTNPPKPAPSSPKEKDGALSESDLDKVSGGAGKVPAGSIPEGDPGLL